MAMSIIGDLVSDLGVKRESLTVIRPKSSTPRRSLFLSNIDQKLVGYVIKFVQFFSLPLEIDYDAIVYVYTEALRRIMVPYDFMCGRLAFNSEKRRFEIDCNAAGVPLAMCTAQLALQDLGDITYPNPAFSQLFFLESEHDGHLISFQATRFRCGGFAVGTAVNHCLMDGFALQEFSRNFNHLAIKGDLAFMPVSDRTSLKARSPLQIKYEHLEFLRPSEMMDQKAVNSSPFMQRKGDILQNKVALHKPSEKHIFGLFSLSGEMLRILKTNARHGGVEHCTSFIAALAHLWRARAVAMANMKPDDNSTVQFAVDVRSRFKPPLAREFAGNATTTAYAKASATEVQNGPFADLVKKLQQGVDRLTDEYLRSRIDWLEMHDGVACLENGFLVTSWSYMGFGVREARGGMESLYAGPVVTGRVDVVVFMADPNDNGGIQIYIGLEPAHMATFRNLIQNVNVSLRSHL